MKSLEEVSSFHIEENEEGKPYIGLKKYPWKLYIEPEEKEEVIVCYFYKGKTQKLRWESNIKNMEDLDSIVPSIFRYSFCLICKSRKDDYREFCNQLGIEL